MDTPDVADVLIIGAGASGGVAARRLVEAGLRVVALEQGDWSDPARYPGSQWDWELAALGPWSSNPNVRRSPADYPIDVSDSDMGIINFNGVGGSTILFNANWHRLMPSDFRRGSETGAGDDWPITYPELEPYYDRTDREIGVSGLAGDPMYPPGAEYPLPPFNLRPGTLKVARVLHQRGWHWWPPTNAILSAPYDGRRGCILRGTCQTGCNEGAKSSIDVTHWRRVVEAGGVVITGARVCRILLDAGGLAAGAQWVDRDGRLNVQRARVVLCAANGVGTPRLLLASACERFPDGLANRSGLVGRRLMLHPISKVWGVFREPLESWEGPFGTDLTCMQFAEMDRQRGFMLPSKWSLHHAGSGPVAAAISVLAEQGPGGEHHTCFRERFGHSMKWIVMCEDLPDESNRVVLSQDLTDSSGVPAPKILYRHTEEVRRALTFNVEQASEVLREAGAFDIQMINPAAADAHLMGTARMGDDPKRSVVNRWGIAHDIPNLGIIDGSSFVTAGCVNPTSTICALALRTAEHLVGNRANWPVPDAPLTRPEGPCPTRPGRAPQSRKVPNFSALEHERLWMLADVLIPGAGEMPPASAIVGGGGGFDRVLSARPDMAARLHAILAEPVPNPIARLRELASQSPSDYGELLVFIAGAYYTDPRIRNDIGYPGQPERLHRPDRVPAYLLEGLLDHLLPVD